MKYSCLTLVSAFLFTSLLTFISCDWGKPFNCDYNTSYDYCLEIIEMRVYEEDDSLSIFSVLNPRYEIESIKFLDSLSNPLDYYVSSGGDVYIDLLENTYETDKDLSKVIIILLTKQERDTLRINYRLTENCERLEYENVYVEYNGIRFNNTNGQSDDPQCAVNFTINKP